jgi:hypothetical protein
MTEIVALLGHLNQHRVNSECLSVEQIIALAADGIIVEDPFAVQISRHVDFQGPCHIRGPVYLLADAPQALTIGCNVYIEGPSTLEAKNGANLSVGDHAVIGLEGGFHVKANRSGSTIELGERIRLSGGGAIFGQSTVGNGAQILGRIQVVNCHLAAGADYAGPDPDTRGAVLKGMGQAENLRLGQGDVIQAFGIFSAAQIRRQAEFHPKAVS